MRTAGLCLLLALGVLACGEEDAPRTGPSTAGGRGGNAPSGSGSGGEPGAAGSGGSGAGTGGAGTSGAAGSGGQNAGQRGLRGAFVLVINDQPAEFYRAAVAEMAALGMERVVVQTESYLAEPDFGRNAVDRSLLQAVLEQAASDGLDVSLGLALPEWGNGDTTAAADGAFVDGAIAASKSSFDGLLADFADRSAWTGVYLPLELWTPGSEGELGELPRYVDEVSDYVKQHSELEVSLSPFVSSLATDGSALTESVYAELFAQADVDVVFLQDGVGARGLTSDEIAGNLPYYTAMASACADRCELWANVEAFAPDFSSPAPWSRFQAQMETLAPTVPDQISYEYTRYFMASGPGGTAAAALHDAYADWL